MLSNLLKTCGLNDTEQSVLLYLLNHGSTTASIIAKQTRIKRTTVYTSLENLIKQALVTKQKQFGASYFSTPSPELICSILENQANQEHKAKTATIKLLKEELQEITSPNRQDFGAFKIEAIDSVAAAYAELEQAFKTTGGFSAIFNPQKAFAKDETNFVPHSNKLKTKIREIATPGPKTEWYRKLIDNPNHQLKELKTTSPFDSDIIITANYVLLIHYDTPRESVIKITQPDFRQSMLTIFEMIWEQC